MADQYRDAQDTLPCKDKNCPYLAQHELRSINIVDSIYIKIPLSDVVCTGKLAAQRVT